MRAEWRWDSPESSARRDQLGQLYVEACRAEGFRTAASRQHNHLPAPQAQAFVACRKITNDPQTGEIVITGPVSHVPITEFPAVIRLAIYAHVTGGHGTFPLAFILRAADGDIVWRKDAVSPLHHPDPLMVAQLFFVELRVSVPKPGQHDLVLVAGGDEIANQPPFIWPAEVFRAEPRLAG